MQNYTEYFCAYCGESNVAFVDLSGGNYQSYIEDCQVCCRPNMLYIQVDEETLELSVNSEYVE
ncbi:MAG: CPXCG motif-containing cysteine-rich protein [Chroococcus sp. CMT-3BRIN-NPC107]|nr:CPXCG motif-containing cysteine-rich protein [Chroococcus sp. CMT-3BRIN-NPC107]